MGLFSNAIYMHSMTDFSSDMLDYSSGHNETTDWNEN